MIELAGERSRWETHAGSYAGPCDNCGVSGRFHVWECDSCHRRFEWATHADYDLLGPAGKCTCERVVRLWCPDDKQRAVVGDAVRCSGFYNPPMPNGKDGAPCGWSGTRADLRDDKTCPACGGGYIFPASAQPVAKTAPPPTMSDDYRRGWNDALRAVEKQMSRIEMPKGE